MRNSNKSKSQQRKSNKPGNQSIVAAEAGGDDEAPLSENSEHIS